MLGYNEWRDVRNDLFLLTCVLKLGSLAYLAYDWYRYHLYGFSYVIGYVVSHFGWDSPITTWVRHLWGLSRGLGR